MPVVKAKKTKSVSPAKKSTTVKKTTIKKKTASAASKTKSAKAKVTAVKAPAKKAAVKKTTAKKPAAKKPVSKKPAAKPVKAVKKVTSKPKKVAVPKVAKAKELPEKLKDAALKVLDERKATEIVSFDVRGRSAIADYAIIASGTSARQLNALAQYLREAFFQCGVKQIRVEGLPQGDWVLIDAGDVLVHLFRPEVRSFYKLEDAWNARPTEI